MYVLHSVTVIEWPGSGRSTWFTENLCGMMLGLGLLVLNKPGEKDQQGNLEKHAIKC